MKGQRWPIKINLEKNDWFSSFLGQTKFLNILRLSLKNDTPFHLIIWFSSCFQNVESIGQQNSSLTFTLTCSIKVPKATTSYHVRQLTIFYNGKQETKNFHLKGRSCSMTLELQPMCQILKPMLSTRSIRKGQNQINLPWHLRVLWMQWKDY